LNFELSLLAKEREYSSNSRDGLSLSYSASYMITLGSNLLLKLNPHRAHVESEKGALGALRASASVL